MKNIHERSKAGFTLVQIAVVLVVVGLLAGAALVEHNYKRVSAAQGDLTQLEKYKSATDTFREKYNYLPGDLPAALAAQLKFVRRDGAQGRGDGNGIIEGYVYPRHLVEGSVQGGETLFFWQDLFSADLIKDDFHTAIDTEPGNDLTGTAIDAYLPKSVLGNGNHVYVYSDKKVNYFGVSAITKIDGNLGTITSHPGLTASQAYAIDHKLDDGLATSGKVLARYVNEGVKDATSANASCYDMSSSHYLVANEGSQSLNCALSFTF